MDITKSIDGFKGSPLNDLEDEQEAEGYRQKISSIKSRVSMARESIPWRRIRKQHKENIRFFNGQQSGAINKDERTNLLFSKIIRTIAETFTTEPKVQVLPAHYAEVSAYSQSTGLPEEENKQDDLKRYALVGESILQQQINSCGLKPSINKALLDSKICGIGVVKMMVQTDSSPEEPKVQQSGSTHEEMGKNAETKQMSVEYSDDEKEMAQVEADIQKEAYEKALDLELEPSFTPEGDTIESIRNNTRPTRRVACDYIPITDICCSNDIEDISFYKDADLIDQRITVSIDEFLSDFPHIPKESAKEMATQVVEQNAYDDRSQMLYGLNQAMGQGSRLSPITRLGLKETALFTSGLRTQTILCYCPFL